MAFYYLSINKRQVKYAYTEMNVKNIVERY